MQNCSDYIEYRNAGANIESQPDTKTNDLTESDGSNFTMASICMDESLGSSHSSLAICITVEME